MQKIIIRLFRCHPGSPEFELATDGFMTRTRVVEGKPFGEMYSRGFMRDSATGQILVRDDGVPMVTAVPNCIYRKQPAGLDRRIGKPVYV